MSRVLGWMAVVFLCCAAGVDAGVEPVDPRLTEAQAAMDEAVKLQQEGSPPQGRGVHLCPGAP